MMNTQTNIESAAAQHFKAEWKNSQAEGCAYHHNGFIILQPATDASCAVTNLLPYNLIPIGDDVASGPIPFAKDVKPVALLSEYKTLKTTQNFANAANEKARDLNYYNVRKFPIPFSTIYTAEEGKLRPFLSLLSAQTTTDNNITAAL